MRAFAIGWAAVTVVMAAGLSAGYGPNVGHLPEGFHLFGHVVLFGVLAAALARDDRRCAEAALAWVLVAGGLVEVAQMAASHSWTPREALYDGMVDGLAGMAGLVVGGRTGIATALGRWLHPALVFPIGLIGTFYAAERHLGSAFGWALCGIVCVLPAAVGWVVGVRRGWFSDADLVAREERPALFALGCASAALFAAVVHGLGAPADVIGVADGIAVAAVAMTALTVAGLKVSGHVAVSLLLAVAIAPWSTRGPLLFVASASLLSWARVRAGVHKPVEVTGAWLLAAAALALR